MIIIIIMMTILMIMMMVLIMVYICIKIELYFSKMYQIVFVQHYSSHKCIEVDLYSYKIIFLKNVSKLICICIKLYFLKMYQSWFVLQGGTGGASHTLLHALILRLAPIHTTLLQQIKADLYLYQIVVIKITRCTHALLPLQLFFITIIIIKTWKTMQYHKIQFNSHSYNSFSSSKYIARQMLEKYKAL